MDIRQNLSLYTHSLTNNLQIPTLEGILDATKFTAKGTFWGLVLNTLVACGGGGGGGSSTPATPQNGEPVVMTGDVPGLFEGQSGRVPLTITDETAVNQLEGRCVAENRDASSSAAITVGYSLIDGAPGVDITAPLANPGSEGTHRVSCEVTDKGYQGAAPKTAFFNFDVPVGFTNQLGSVTFDAPVENGALSMKEGETQTVTYTVLDPDVDKERGPVTVTDPGYVVNEVPATNDQKGTLTLTPGNLDAGEDVITITYSDNGTAVSESFTLTVADTPIIPQFTINSTNYDGGSTPQALQNIDFVGQVNEDLVGLTFGNVLQDPESGSYTLTGILNGEPYNGDNLTAGPWGGLTEAVDNSTTQVGIFTLDNYQLTDEKGSVVTFVDNDGNPLASLPQLSYMVLPPPMKSNDGTEFPFTDLQVTTTNLDYITNPPAAKPNGWATALNYLSGQDDAYQKFTEATTGFNGLTHSNVNRLFPGEQNQNLDPMRDELVIEVLNTDGTNAYGGVAIDAPLYLVAPVPEGVSNNTIADVLRTGL